MQKPETQTKYFTWELGLAIAFYLVCFTYSYWSLIWGSEAILGKDAAAWYGPFHFFIESVSLGSIPYWNPYSHGGEPFYFTAQHFRLFDPLMFLPVLHAKFFNGDLLKLYNVFLVLKELLYTIGVVFLIRYFFRNRLGFLFLCFLFLCLYQNEVPNLDKTNLMVWFPWFALSSVHFYQTAYRRSLYIAAYFLGVMIGTGNVTVLYLFGMLFAFLFALCVTDFRKLTTLVKTHCLDMSLAWLLSIFLSLPFFITQLEKSEVYPVGESYGAREYSIQQFQSEVSHPPLNYELNFLNPSYFAGNYLKPQLLKYYLSYRPNGLMTLAICLMLVGLILGRFHYKRHIALCLLWILHLSIATTPTYRFLFLNAPFFNQLKHPIGFLLTAEILLVFFAGYGLSYFLEHKNKFYTRMARVLLILSFLTLGPASLFKSLEKWKSGLVDRTQTVNQLNPIYEELSRKHFQASNINFSPERAFATPRPGVLLYEPLLLKKNLALTTIIEPAKGSTYGGSPYMRIAHDPVISNRTLYWPRLYVPIYLMGEKNIGAFLDLMGIGQPLIRFYSKNQTMTYPPSLLSKLFSNFDYQYDGERRLKYSLTQDKLFLQQDKVQKTDDISSPAKITPQIVHFNPNSIGFNVNIPENGYLLYNDSYSSNWSAYVDGKTTPIFLANLAFKAIEIEKGGHFIRFNYFPIFFAISIYITFFIHLFVLIKLVEWIYYVLISRLKVKRWAVRFQ